MNISVVQTKEINPDVKPFLVDVPVKTNIWIRPNCQRKQFEIIKKARPSVLAKGFVIFIMNRNGN